MMTTSAPAASLWSMTLVRYSAETG
jgi:hypothetical protein